MGLLDSILDPIKAVTRGLEAPVHLVEKVFGEVIKFVEETINLIEGMITEIENLFNASKIEKIFFYPFKESAVMALDSVEKIFNLLKDLIPTTEGFKDFLLEPINDVYESMGDVNQRLKDEASNIITDLENFDSKLISSVENRFEIFLIKTEGFADDILTISKKIEREFKLETEKIIDVVPEFTGLVEKEILDNGHKVTKNFSTEVQSFKNIEQSIKTKLSNENFALDLIIVLLFLLVIFFLVGMYFLTNSFLTVIAVFFILFISVIIFFSNEFLRIFSK